ncbi:MAG: response regulator transcription factor [Bacteroidales bacterium]|nr:response regulator transcription factor [Bacteroidales bacterium]
MNIIKALIIEDEQPAIDLILSYLNDHDDIEVVECCKDGFHGLKAIQQHQPDLIFLDIQMPKITGFEMLEVIDNPPEIIFSTAYDQYAITAFDMNAVDYLLKPYSKKRFAKALDKVRERISKQENSSGYYQTLIESVNNEKESLDRIVVKSGSKIQVIDLKDIYYVESDDDYVLIHTAHDKFIKNGTLKYYETHLPQVLFIRVHRSAIVNITYIDRLDHYGKESYMLIMKNGSQIKVSKSRIKELRKELRF